MCCRQFASCMAVHRECSDSNRLGTALLQRDECAADRRSGIDDVVDYRDTFAPKLGLKWLGDWV